MSKQKDIIDAIITALESVTGVNKVTKDVAVWNQADPMSYSTLYISLKKEEGDQVYFRHPTADDMHAELEITIQGDVREKLESGVETAIDTLLKNVEIAINGSSAIDNLLIDIYCTSDEYIKVDNFGLFSAVYFADFEYNHLAP
jgi:hypothetical protein